MALDPVTLIIRGKHDTGKTTLASLVKMFLEENGYRQVTVTDTSPLPIEAKSSFSDRFARNRERPIHIEVVLEAEVGRWTCPKCGRSHDRGPVNASTAYRCLHCGLTFVGGL